ncbi:hypothetical protein [Chromobacterium subtsugae]|uniref:hypothetical protein n=1 Tax=Chromobacterium subtsugae TaxID=251747 RepID=UPI000641693A|nr:hypothetical protein [Chromobacterium subtsugae]
MTWHIEDDVGVVFKGSETSCIGRMQQLRRQSILGLPLPTCGAVRVVNHQGVVAATLLADAPQQRLAPTNRQALYALDQDMVEHLGHTPR